jgi:hypothetical protein
VAVLTIQLTKKQIDRFVNKLVSFSYGRKSSSNSFYGYVVTINPITEYKTDTTVEISCIGVTWPMQSGTPRFERNSTVPSIFSKVVSSYGLGVQIETHPYIWSAVAQCDLSDWEFVLHLADKIGFSVYTYRGVVRLIDAARVLRNTPVFQQFVRGDDVLDKSRELIDWTATTQSMNLRENIQPAFGFFEAGEPSSSRVKIERPYRLLTSTVTLNRDMSKVYEDAWNRRPEFWTQSGQARINGNALVAPGMNVSIKTSPFISQSNDFDGVWLVREVSHSLTHNSFQTLLSLSRDKGDEKIPSNNTQFSWFWNSSKGAPRVLKNESSGLWKSSWGSSPDIINGQS